MRKPEDIARRIAEARNKAGNKGKKPVLMADLQPASEPQKAPALPAITDNDINFAKSVHFEYENKGKKIDFEPLCQLIRDIRHDLNKQPEDFNAGMLKMNQIFQDKIKGIDQLKGVKSLNTKINTVAAKEFETSLNYIVFMKVWNFFKNTDLGPQQKRIATGMILQHFNLFGLTWKPDGSYSYYWQYLSDRIEKIVKRLNQRKGPGDNIHINAKSI